jgi:dihydrofolate reductase
VVSRRPDWKAVGAEVVTSLALALARCAEAEEVFVIGGAELYREALLRADRLYITRVEAQVPGDARFPTWDETAWRLESEELHPADARHPHAFRFCVYERT